jgi:hypothetical protein
LPAMISPVSSTMFFMGRPIQPFSLNVKSSTTTPAKDPRRGHHHYRPVLQQPVHPPEPPQPGFHGTASTAELPRCSLLPLVHLVSLRSLLGVGKPAWAPHQPPVPVWPSHHSWAGPSAADILWLLPALWFGLGSPRSGCDIYVFLTGRSGAVRGAIPARRITLAVTSSPHTAAITMGITLGKADVR